MKQGFHVRAWVAWLAAASLFTLSIDNPFADLAALLALAAVAVRFRAPGPEGRTAALLFKAGIVIIAIRIVLFGLTGHPGATTLFTLPSAGLPRWLGGFSIGGRVTGEVVMQQVAEGLKIAAFLACFGVFLASVETYRVLRMLPRFLLEAGLIASIAITFVPALLRSAADVRDAQRLRGHRFRGLRSLRPVVVPVLAGALERSLTLAASMDSRGYGRSVRSMGHDLAAHGAVLGGLVVLVAGGGLLLAGLGVAGLAAVAIGTVLVAAGLRTLSATVTRTRLRADRLDVWDVALIVFAGAMAAGTLAARTLAAAHWYPFPAVTMPDADMRLLALGAAVAAPAVLAGVRAISFKLIESRHPVAEAGA